MCSQGFSEFKHWNTWSGWASRVVLVGLIYCFGWYCGENLFHIETKLCWSSYGIQRNNFSFNSLGIFCLVAYSAQMSVCINKGVVDLEVYIRSVKNVLYFKVNEFLSAQHCIACVCFMRVEGLIWMFLRRHYCAIEKWMHTKSSCRFFLLFRSIW